MKVRNFIGKNGLRAVSSSIEDDYASVEFSDGNRTARFGWSLYDAADKRAALAELNTLLNAVETLVVAVDEADVKKKK